MPGSDLAQRRRFAHAPFFSHVTARVKSAASRRIGGAWDVAPEHDTPARLQAYAQRFKAKPQWRFLTGKRADLVSVQRAFDVNQGNKMQHQPITFLRTSPTEPWVRLNGFMSAAELVAEYRRLMAR